MPGQISEFVDGSLEPDEVERIDCREITDGFGIGFIHGAEGFLVVESLQSLDVVAVYTGAPRGGEVTTMDVEQVEERRLR